MAVFPELITALAIPLNKTNIRDFLYKLERQELLDLIVRKKPCFNLLPDYLALTHSEYEEIFTDTYLNTGLLYLSHYDLFPECHKVYQSFNKNYIQLNKAKSNVPIKEIRELTTKLDSLGIYLCSLDWSWYTFMDYVRI